MFSFFGKISQFLLTKRGFFVGITLILIFATFSRFYKLSYPKVYYFDEVYHALTAKLIARGDQRAFEWWNSPVEPNTAVDWLHPPLAKYTQALSMLVFGENSFGWRFSSAVFGILVIAATGWVAHTYFHRRSLTLLALLLAASDGLLLAQSRIAMNDIHVTFFILTTVAIYAIFRRKVIEGKGEIKWMLATGISAGLAMGSKWSGIYVLFAIWVMEFVRILQSRKDLRQRLIKVVQFVVLLVIIPALMYLASYTDMFLQGKSLVCLGNEVKQGSCYCSQESSTWVVLLSDIFPSRKAQFEALEARGGCKRLISHFSELHHQILWYQTHLTATHPYQSVPWQWVLDIRPVWLYVNYDQAKYALFSNIYDTGNPLLYWTGIAAVLLVSFFFVTSREERNWKLGFLLLVYFIVWAPWNFSPRIMFFYHYAPAVPIMAILIAYVFVSLSDKSKALKPVFAMLTIAIFLVYLAMFPLNTGLPVPMGYFDTIFKLFPTWK